MTQQARIEERTGYNVLSRLFEGDVRATSYENQARATRQAGTASAISSGLRTVSTVLKNAPDIYEGFKPKRKPKGTGSVTTRDVRNRYRVTERPY
jgi:hypothetical protein